MNSLKLILRFSYKPNTLGLCGRKEPQVYELLKKERWSHKEKERAESFARGLKVFYAYLRAVGDACNKQPFDAEVVEACIIGWNRWRECGKEAAELLKKHLKPVALPKKLDEIAGLPVGVPLTHNFHTLYFGAIASDIPRILSFADQCKVSLGTVMDEGVSYNKLLPGLKTGEGMVKMESPFFPVERGDRVFLHHGIVFKKASDEEIGIYKDNLALVVDAVKDSWEF